MKTHHPEHPAPKTGRVQNLGVTLHAPQEVFAANVSVEALMGLIRSILPLVESEAGPGEEGKLSFKFTIYAKKNPECAYKYAGHLSEDFLNRVHQSMRKLPALKTRENVLSFEVLFEIHKAAHKGH